MKFNALIKNATITFPNESYARHHLSKLEGKEVIVDVERPKNWRSISQNRYYWVLIEIIAEATGNERDDIHRYCKGMYLPKRVIKINGKEITMSGSTTDLTKGQMVEYIELGVKPFGASLGLILPSADEFNNLLEVK